MAQSRKTDGFLGQNDQAEPLYLRVLHIQEQALGPEHPELAYPLYGLALLFYKQGKDKQAEPFYLRVLRIREQALGPGHPLVAHPLHGLATLYLRRSQYERAEPLYQRALRIREQALGPEHPEVAESLNGLASLYQEQNRYGEAEEIFQRALSIREQRLGQHHPETAQTLHDLALLKQKQGKSGEAFSVAERALQIRSQSLGDTHPKTIATRTLSTQLLQEQACAEIEAAPARRLEKMPDPRGEEGHAEEALLTLHKIEDPSCSENDSLREFLDACCELHSRAWCRVCDLWQAYERWAEEHQEHFPLARRVFAAQLKARGCYPDRTNTSRIWHGITLVKREP